jgi:putative peptidoglycan lipid II flippase
MYIGLIAMLANLVLNLVLIWPFGGRGLAFSTALVAACQCAATALWLQHRIGPLNWRHIAQTTAKTLIATAGMAVVCLILLDQLVSPAIPFGRLVRLGLPLASGGIVFLLIAQVLGLKEPWRLITGKSLSNSAD